VERDEEKIGRLKQIMDENPIGFVSMLRSQTNKDLLEYINCWCSRFMLKKHKLSTRCWYAVNGIDDYVKCKKCGKPIIRNVITIMRPQLEYCCRACAYASEEFADNIRQSHLALTPEQLAEKSRRSKNTRHDRYGDENYTNREKAAQTCEVHYGKGITNPGQAPAVKAAIRDTMNIKYGKHFTQTEEYIEKTNATCQRKYGTDFPGQNEEARTKRIATNEKLYGGPGPMCSESVREKSEETCLDKYGVPKVSQCKEISEKQKAGYAKTCDEKYNGLRPSETAEIKKKISDTVKSEDCQERTKNTTFEKYGVEHVYQDPDFRRKAQFRYVYDGIAFDSNPEIAMHIWLTDNNIQFEYQPDCDFWYEYMGKRHRYYPDFKIGDMYCEIKGDHMISESGKWICPWDRTKDGLYKAKQECAEVNGIRIITSDEYSRYLKYVSKKYGRGYLDSFKNGKHGKGK
jgi:hypothetical protein